MGPNGQEDDYGDFLSSLDRQLNLPDSPPEAEEDIDIFGRIDQYVPIGDKLRSLDRVVGEVNPVNSFIQGMRDAEQGNYLDSFVNTVSSLPIPAGIVAKGRGLFDAPVANLTNNIVENTTRPIIRLDDSYRGAGEWRTSMDVGAAARHPFATRTTAQSQIDDMVATGVVRPPPGGYQGEAVIYFGGHDGPVPTNIFNRPNPSKPYTIVARSDVVAGRTGPITLDELQHIWTYENGELVDVLPDLIRRNIEYQQGYYEGGLITSTGPAGSPLTRDMREGGEQRTFRQEENFIPQREEPPVSPPTIANYFTPEEAQRRFAQYLPIESTPNDVLMPSDDPRVYTYQMANGSIYHVPAYEEVLQERRSVGEAFNHLVDNFPSRTEVESGLMALPQAAYGAISNMVTGQGTYEDVIGTATGLVGVKALPRSRYTDEIVGEGVDENAVDVDFEPIGDDPLEDLNIQWDPDPEPQPPANPLTPEQIIGPVPEPGNWLIPPAPLREGKKMPTVPLYPPRDYTPNGYEPEDTIVFRSPVREFVAGVQIPAQGIKGSQFLKMLQDNPSIRNSEVSYLNLGISPEARYTREELQQLVDSRVPQVEAYFTGGNNYPSYQRQPVRDFEENYEEIVITAAPQDPSGKFRANSQHFDEDTLAHARVSLRTPDPDSYADGYVLVEEMQSDLIQKGWQKPPILDNRTFEEWSSVTEGRYLPEQIPPLMEALQQLNKKHNEITGEDLFDGGYTHRSISAQLLQELENRDSQFATAFQVRDFVEDYADYLSRNRPSIYSAASEPPIRTTQESTRLIVESLISYADRMGVDEIVFPPLERIAAERFQPGTKDYQKALTPGSGFHQTYVTSLKKVIQEMQNELGEDAISVYRKELPYGSGNTPSIDFEDARGMWNDLQLIRSRIKRESPNASLQDVDGEVVERLANIPSYLTGFETGMTLLDDYISRFGNDFMSAQSLDELYENNARMTDPLLPTEGVAINIGGLRNQYNLQYPRFAEGGLVTQTRSAFGEIA